MSRTHEVPNHLNVQDTLFLGLTARQVATFMAFASPAYGIWDQLTIAPLAVRGTLAALVVLLGIGVRAGANPVDGRWTNGRSRSLPTWLPRGGCAGVGRKLTRCEWYMRAHPGWVDLAPRLGWGSGAAQML